MNTAWIRSALLIGLMYGLATALTSAQQVEMIFSNHYFETQFQAGSHETPQAEMVIKRSSATGVNQMAQPPETRIVRNDSAPGTRAMVAHLPVYANGDYIGTLLGIDHFISHTSWLSVLSDNNYPFEVAANGVLQFFDLFYQLPDCKGQPFFMSIVSNFLPSMGFVFQIPAAAGLGFAAYIPKGSANLPAGKPMSKLHFSFDGGNCTDDNSEGYLIRVLSNDPSITGVPNSNFLPPITFGAG